MCIIIYKPKDVSLPEEHILKTCFDNNPHGAGIMYKKGFQSQVFIQKGLMTFDYFMEILNTIPEQHEMALHFRIGTAGKNNQGNCHPFPVTDNFKKMIEIEQITNLALVHNGILTKYDYKNSIFSDTMHFIAEILSDSFVLDNMDNPTLIRLLEDYTDFNKFLFFAKGKETFTLGDAWEKKDDIYYSNKTYKIAYAGYINDRWYNPHSHNIYDSDEYLYEACPECGNSAELCSEGYESCEGDNFNSLRDDLKDLYQCIVCGVVFDENDKIWIESIDKVV